MTAPVAAQPYPVARMAPGNQRLIFWQVTTLVFSRFRKHFVAPSDGTQPEPVAAEAKDFQCKSSSQGWPGVSRKSWAIVLAPSRGLLCKI